MNKHSENIALICLWQQNSQGLEEILRGEDVLHVRKHSGDSEVHSQTTLVFTHFYVFFWQLPLDACDERRYATFLSICHKNRAAQGQNWTLYLFCFYRKRFRIRY